MLEHFSIVLVSCRPGLLKRCIWSLKHNSRFSHELIVCIDKHGTNCDNGWAEKWEGFELPESDEKLKIEYLTTDRFVNAPLDSKWKIRGKAAFGKSSEGNFCHQNITYSHCNYEWILGPSDDDFFYLPDWDYNLLKYVDINDKKIIYIPKQLCPREGVAAKKNDTWIGFEHPEGSTDSRLRGVTPLKVSYALEKTAYARIDQAFLTTMKDFRYGFNLPLLMHRDTILAAANKTDMLEAADALWDGVEGPWTSLNAFTAYGCAKCSSQNSNMIHYSGTLIDDTQDPTIIWIPVP
jgi:hypothetical protein